MSRLSSVPAYGLLHIATGMARHENLSKSGADALNIYLKCAALCARSVRTQGGDFYLITNERDFLRRQLDVLGLGELHVIGHEFRWDVPRTLRFHSAHYKLEILEAFGRQEYGPAALLIDIDTVLLRPFEHLLLHRSSLIAYDISDQIPAEQLRKMTNDLVAVAGQPLRSACWWGGEFIAGTAESFAALSDIISARWPAYLRLAANLRHVGDEMLVSVALNILQDRGWEMVDAGRAGLVARWWSARTDSRQAQLSHVQRRSLLHLPADKEFLARQSRRPFDASSFLARYRRHARRKIALRRIADVIDSVRGRASKHLPRL